MLGDADVFKRQLWGLPTHTTTAFSRHCTPFTLPSNGVLAFKGSALTLTTDVVFQPECTGTGVQEVSSVANFKDPFYASTIPQTYVIAAATVIAWILVIMLIITPRTNFLGQSGAAAGFSNGHGIIGGATGGGTNLIGVGSRPWLQKAAALTVAVSLTIATADTFRAAEKQYEVGYMNANALRDEVLGSLEIKITRVISDVFVWLAQVQTLIRLFPRHKEKVLIKWIGFALILFDSLFSCLNSFMINTTHQPRHFVDAIPALSYLFELALGLLYAAWVIYYALTKRRYAFYHPKMRSISLIALLSLIAILTPVVFFVTDVSNQDVAGWGDYFRWVGAAAASVVVWEWVERIEALERDEKKDGILGREIFDGDEMLDVTPSDEVVWTQTRHGRNQYRRNDDSDNSGDPGNQSSALEQGLSNVTQRLRPRQRKRPEHFPLGRAHSHGTTLTSDNGQAQHTNNTITFGTLPKPREQQPEPPANGPTPPPVVPSPVSRADTTSAASTVYVVQYNPTADIPQPVRRRADASGNTEQTIARAQAQRQSMQVEQNNMISTTDPEKEAPAEEAPQPNRQRGNGAWFAVSNPFKRKRASPPAEIQQARQVAVDRGGAATPAHNFSPWDLKNRVGVLAAETGEKLRDKRAGRRQEHADAPVTIIPAQPRGSGRTWTPPAFTSNGRQRSEQSPAAESSSSSSNEPALLSGAHTDQPTKTTAGSANTAAPRVNTSSPLGAGGTSSPSPAPTSSPSTRSPPPRASDLSPVAGNPVIIPAPARRSNRSSPLATFRTAAGEGSSGS